MQDGGRNVATAAPVFVAVLNVNAAPPLWLASFICRLSCYLGNNMGRHLPLILLPICGIYGALGEHRARVPRCGMARIGNWWWYLQQRRRCCRGRHTAVMQNYKIDCITRPSTGPNTGPSTKVSTRVDHKVDHEVDHSGGSRCGAQEDHEGRAWDGAQGGARGDYMVEVKACHGSKFRNKIASEYNSMQGSEDYLCIFS